MNKVKGVLAIALILFISAPCFASNAEIKRKKNKWQHSMEQQAPIFSANKSETGTIV